jgi:RNA polymerase sigma factor (sigma-70 family)
MDTAERRAGDAMDRVDDIRLVAAARLGDKEAFGQLLIRHQPLLLAMCRRTLQDPELAEDAAQEASLQALLSLDRLRGDDRFGSWLAGIGLNVCRRWRRGTRGDWSWEAVTGGGRGPEPVDAAPDPAERAAAADRDARVRLAVAELPRGQRAAVALVYLSGLTLAETADALGIEVGAVKTRLHKGRASLRKELWAMSTEGEMAVAEQSDAVAVRIIDVRRGPAKEGHPPHAVVVLEEVDGGRRLPIWIGDFEATALALQLEGVETPRPMTYAFAASMLQASGGRLREVRVARLDGDVYYAVVVVGGAQGTKEIDARPSDALNVALLAGAPIRVATGIFDAAGGAREAPDDPQADAPRGAAAIAAEALAEWSSRSPAATPAASDAAP